MEALSVTSLLIGAIGSVTTCNKIPIPMAQSGHYYSLYTTECVNVASNLIRALIGEEDMEIGNIQTW